MAYPTLTDFTAGALDAHAQKHGGVQDDCDICTLYIFVATMFDHTAPRGLDTPLTGFRFPDLQAELSRAKPGLQGHPDTWEAVARPNLWQTAPHEDWRDEP